MASTTSNHRLADIGFADSNPAIAAYQTAVKFGDDREAAALAAERARLGNELDRGALPSRLRTIHAGADSAESNADTAGANADVATASVPYGIRSNAANASSAESSARLAGSNADVGVATVQDRIRSAGAGADTAVANSRTAGVGADVAEATAGDKIATSGADAGVNVATAPNRISQSNSATRLQDVQAGVEEETAMPRAKANLRQTEAGATNTEAAPFYKALDFLNEGKVAEAQEIYRRAYGKEIPQEVVNNSDLRAAVTQAAKTAKETYPNRPADQQAYIKKFIEDMATRQGQGQQASAPAAPHQVPGAPEPQEDTTRTSYEMLPTTRMGADGKQESGYLQHNKGTGQYDFVSGYTAQSRTGAGGGGRPPVWQLKHDGWLAAHPGDAAGALEYANNRNNKAMSESEIMKASLTMAQREIGGNMQLKFGGPAQQKAAINQRALEIAQQLRGAAAPAAQPGAVPPAVSPAPPPAAVAPPPQPTVRPPPPQPDKMTPGDGGRPLDVQVPQRPPMVPAGSQYSPSRGMWRSPDGKVFDKNGQPVG